MYKNKYFIRLQMYFNLLLKQYFWNEILKNQYFTYLSVMNKTISVSLLRTNHDIINRRLPHLKVTSTKK